MINPRRSSRSVPIRAPVFAGRFHNGFWVKTWCTVNSGSDSVRYLRIRSASPLMQTISSGGNDPTALAVNLYRKWSGGLGGRQTATAISLCLSPVQTAATLRPSCRPPDSQSIRLALASFNGADLEFYATTEGEASAPCWDFNSKRGCVVRSFARRGGGLGSASLAERTSLALVGTLLTLTLETQNESEQSSESAPPRSPPPGPGASAKPARSGSHSRGVGKVWMTLRASPRPTRRPLCLGLDL